MTLKSIDEVLLSHKSTEEINRELDKENHQYYYFAGGSLFIEGDYESTKQFERNIKGILFRYPCSGLANMNTSIFSSSESSTGLRYFVEGTVLTKFGKK